MITSKNDFTRGLDALCEVRAISYDGWMGLATIYHGIPAGGEDNIKGALLPPTGTPYVRVFLERCWIRGTPGLNQQGSS